MAVPYRMLACLALAGSALACLASASFAAAPAAAPGGVPVVMAAQPGTPSDQAARIDDALIGGAGQAPPEREVTRRREPPRER